MRRCGLLAIYEYFVNQAEPLPLSKIEANRIKEVISNIVNPDRLNNPGVALTSDELIGLRFSILNFQSVSKF